MGLGDCIKCWDTPCRCGYGYRNYGEEKMYLFIRDMLSYYSNEQKQSIINKVLIEIINE